MKLATLLRLLASALALALSVPTHAGSAGWTQASATYVHSQDHYYSYSPLRKYTYSVETLALSAGSDTVLQVFDAANGSLAASNDDSSGTLASFVDIPTTMSGRTMRILVHAYGPGRSGNAVLHIQRKEWTLLNTLISTYDYYYGIEFAGSRLWVAGPLPAGTHFFTSRVFNGSPDTMLLALDGYSRAVGFSDNEGVGEMSAIHLAGGCNTVSCSVVVGTLNPSLWLYDTKLIWDADAHVLDSDADGLSDTLEAQVGTSAIGADSDGDGIKDGEELLGVDDVNLPLHFLLYGADPRLPDIFVQADWEKCVPRNALDHACGDPASPDADALRMTGEQALKAAEMYGDIRVHIDTGRENWDAATSHIFNAWGGAARYENPAKYDFCEQLRRTPSRIGYFHGGRITQYSPNWSTLKSACFQSSNNGQTYAHELAHNMNIGDGGAPSTGTLPCKPNHRSQMNYAFAYEPEIAFSRGEFPWFVPAQMNEEAGLGTSNPADLAHLQLSTMRYAVYANGSVDWNRDGQIGDTDAAGNYTPIVRAAPTWAWGWNCNATADRWNVLDDREEAALGWLYGTLYVFSRRATDSFLEYRRASASSMPDQCPISPYGCTTNWSPDDIVPSSVAAIWAPAVARYAVGATAKLFLVYVDADRKLRYQTLTSSSQPWSVPQYVGNGTETVSGSPAAVVSNGVLHVFAPTAGGLARWQFDSTTGSFSAPSYQRWNDTGQIIAATGAGVGVASGYIKNGTTSSSRVVAAIPTAPDGIIELAWLDQGDRWVRLAASSWWSGRKSTDTRPGIAYVPFGSGSPTVGRFYVAWKEKPSGTDAQAPAPAMINMTEGNDIAGTAVGRRLIWHLSPVRLGSNVHIDAIQSVTLLFDGEYDKNLRAGFTTRYNSGGVYGAAQAGVLLSADGVFNMLEGNNDEYAFMKSNLACALAKGVCIE